jgi:hypothetical protein
MSGPERATARRTASIGFQPVSAVWTFAESLDVGEVASLGPNGPGKPRGLPWGLVLLPEPCRGARVTRRRGNTSGNAEAPWHEQETARRMLQGSSCWDAFPG